MKLPLFQGGFTVEAAEEIAGASLRTLTSLVDRSLLWHDVSAGRLDMHKLLREFAEDKLRQVGQADAVREAHSAYHLDLLCRLGEDVKGGDRQVEALEAIDADIENIRAAWDWALKNQAYERVKEAADVLYRVLSFRRRLEEGAQLFRRAANALESRADEDSRRLLGPVRARQAMLAAGYLSNEDAIHLLERSLESARRYDMPAERAFCLRGIGEALLDLEGPRTAKPVLEESLAIASAIDARWIQIPVLVALHDVAMLEGKPGEANRLARQLLTVCRETGDSISLSFASYRLGVSECYVGRYEEGKRRLEESLAIRQRLKDPARISNSRVALALYATRVEGNCDEARVLAEPSLAVGRSINDPHSMTFSLVALSDVACWQERYAEAARRAEESLQIIVESGDSEAILFGRDALALALCGLGAYRDAKEQICAALRLCRRRSHNPKALVLAHLAGMALVLAHEGNSERATELYALAASHPARTRAWLERLTLYKKLRVELEAKVPPEIFTRAWERGRKLDLEEAVTSVVSERCL